MNATHNWRLEETERLLKLILEHIMSLETRIELLERRLSILHDQVHRPLG
jgi:Mg2+ and Co2+ transporter CorA